MAVWSQSQLRRTLGIALTVLLLLFGWSQAGRRVASAVLRPFSSLGRGCSRWFGLVRERVVPNYERVAQYEHADEMLQQAEMLAAAGRQAMEENAQLRELLKVGAPAEWRSVPAAVVMREPATWNWQFQINRGEADGVALGNPVMFGHFLVGRVTEVTQHGATVSTLLSADCRFGVYVKDQQDVMWPGIFQGGEHAIIDYLDKRTAVTTGAAVFTSGMGDTMPYGLPVCTLAPNSQGECVELVNGARACANVAFPRSFQHISFVMIFVRK
ncbi:MAG: rod shape-determining protein MreC [Victivallales bacterium]|nr:rod shape-determining protein MreC [Victivallales bacterium]